MNIKQKTFPSYRDQCMEMPHGKNAMCEKGVCGH